MLTPRLKDLGPGWCWCWQGPHPKSGEGTRPPRRALGLGLIPLSRAPQQRVAAAAQGLVQKHQGHLFVFLLQTRAGRRLQASQFLSRIWGQTSWELLVRGQRPSRGVDDGVGAGEGASTSCSRGPRLLQPSWDLLRTTWVHLYF